MNRRTFNKLVGLLGASALGGQQPPAGRPEPDGRNLWNHYFLGAAYYPEWWTPSEWEIDFRQMQQLGINTVRMGEFAWAFFEPAPGKFDFAWMDRAIDVANRHGVDVILATPTASVPPWLYQLHPDVLDANAKGPYTYGGRKGYCTNSQHYLDASARITTALAEHYGRFREVIGWQLDNEPGFPFECYDSNCERAFQVWLQKHYGSLAALNRTWNGAFWSNEYSDWSQIHFPTNSAEGGWQPAISLDYRRFFSDSFLNHLRRQATILHEYCKDQFVYTNWPTATWSVDVFTAAEFLNAAAWDNYVSAPGISDFHRQYISGFQNDMCRCAGPQQRFLSGEQIAYVPPNALTEGLRLQAYINLAHGSHGQLYFEWRRPLAGNEQFRPSLIKRFDGTINPAKPVFEQISKEFAQLGPLLADATTHADIALLYDFTNEWSQGFWSVGDRNDRYDSAAGRYYNGFKVLQRNLDVIPCSTDLSTYKLIITPNLRLTDDLIVQRLKVFVTRGGTLVLTNRAGTQNLDASMKRVLSPGSFEELAGVTAEAKLDLGEYNSPNGTLDRTLNAELGIVFRGAETAFPPRTILESLVLHGAEPVAIFRGGRMAGKPAITRNQVGRGWVFYVATDCAESAFHEALARAVGTTANLSPLVAAPYGVEVTSRESSEAIFYFLLNLTETAHKDILLPEPMRDVITGQSGLTKISLAPLGVAVIAAARPRY